MGAEHDADGSREDRVNEQDETFAAASGGNPTTNRRAWEWAKSIAIAFGLLLMIRAFVLEAYRIPTGSMQSTLLVGDFLLVNKAVYGAPLPFSNRHLPGLTEPKRGDVVVFVPPHERDRNYVKRMVATAGDTVAMRDKVLYVNGEAQDEPYARHTQETDAYVPRMKWQCAYAPDPDKRRRGCTPTRDNWGPIVVPPGKMLMLGDNRDDSEDSRYWGFADRASVLGKPLLVYYSFDEEHVDGRRLLDRVRWARIGTTVH